MKKTLLVLLALALGSLALYSIIPSNKLEDSIVGEWILTDYKYEPLTEDAKYFRLDLEEKKNAKTTYTFKEGGTAGFGNGGGEFFYIADSSKVYVWNGVNFPYTKTVTEEIKKHDQTQIMDAVVDNNKMQLVMNNPNYRITLFFTR